MSILDRKIAPAFKTIEQIELKKAEKLSLDNGIPIYVLNGGSQDVAKIDLIINAGANYSNEKLTTPMLALMLNEGTKKHTAHQIAETFDFYGAHFHPKAEKDNAFASLVTLNKHLKQTLPLFEEIISESQFPEKELSILLKRRKQNHLIDLEKTAFLSREAFASYLFGENHPYGKRTNVNMYDEFDREALTAFYDRKYHAGNYSLVVSGKVGNTVVEMLHKTFGQLPIMLGQKQHNDAPKATPGKYFIEKKEAVQSSIRMGFNTINKYHHDYHGLKILITLFGGYFGSRLMKNIREEKGYTYGIHAMLVSLQETGYVGIAADVKTEFANQAVDEIKKEIEILKNEMVSEEELALVKNYMMGDMLQMFDGPFAKSDAFINSIQFGFGFSYYERMMDKILSISAKEIQQLANNYFDFETFVTVIAGKA